MFEFVRVHQHLISVYFSLLTYREYRLEGRKTNEVK